MTKTVSVGSLALFLLWAACGPSPKLGDNDSGIQNDTSNSDDAGLQGDGARNDGDQDDGHLDANQSGHDGEVDVDSGSPVPCPNGQDEDGDGYGNGCPAGEDCNDQDPDVHPGAQEVCNGIDDDCDGRIPDGEQDADGDGIIECLSPIRGYACSQGDQGKPLGGGEGYGLWVDPNGDRTTVVHDLNGLLQTLAAAQPGDVIYVADDAVIDLSPMADEEIIIPDGVTLASGRGRGGSAGALLLTTSHDQNTHTARTVFAVTGPAVRITGLRFQGPDTSVGTTYESPLITGILTRFPDGHRNWSFEVDNCEFWGWPVAAVSVYRTDRAFIHHNFFHHNRRAGLGYGVVVNYANPVIGVNIFQHNRHGIASTGYPTTGYEACHNLVLPGATSTSFDMHGGFDKGFSPDTAGSIILIHHNIFLAGTVDGIGIRGEPADHAELHHNTFVHSPNHVYPSAMWQRYFPAAPECLDSPGCVLQPWADFPGYFLMQDKSACRDACEPYSKRRDPATFVNIDVHDDHYGASHQPGWFFSRHGQAYWMLRRLDTPSMDRLLTGDFDGDGADDALEVAGGSWTLFPKWRGNGTLVNASGASLADMAVGDFDGDGTDDVFWANGTSWQVSWSATSAWQRLNTSGVRASSLAFCDFDGDGHTDVMRSSGGTWSVSWSGTSSWQQLNTLGQPLDQIHFGDLDADGACDVFYADGSHWKASWGGQSPYETINTSSATTVRLADLDGDSRADVVRSSGSVWYVSWSGRSSWQELNPLGEENITSVVFADVDGDGAADAVIRR